MLKSYDVRDLLGKEHEEMVAVAPLEDRLRCVAVELDHLKHESSDSLFLFVTSPSNFELTNSPVASC